MTDTANVLDPRVQELLDRDAIRQVVARYFRGVDRGDAELAASCFHPDAVDERGTWVMTGDELGRDVTEHNLRRMLATNHHVTTHVITIAGDLAGSEASCLGVHVTGGERPRRMVTSSRYLDRLERRNGEWRIIRREVLMNMVHKLPLEDDAALQPARDRTDPSYAVLELVR